MKHPDDECFEVLWVVRARLLSLNDKNKNDCNYSLKVMHLGLNTEKLNFMKLSRAASISSPNTRQGIRKKTWLHCKFFCCCCCTHGTWKFPGHGLNLCHSSYPNQSTTMLDPLSTEPQENSLYCILNTIS